MLDFRFDIYTLLLDSAELLSALLLTVNIYFEVSAVSIVVML